MTTTSSATLSPAELRSNLSAWLHLTIWIKNQFKCLLVVCALLLSACSTQTGLVSHGFYFDGNWGDGWEKYTDLLAFDYGGKYAMVRSSVENPKRVMDRGKDKLSGTLGVNGPMPVGEYLYVKWRIRSTRQVIEDRVDLRDRLPFKMQNQRLTFVIDGRQLYVYIVTDKPKKYRGEPPILKTHWSETYHTYEIYPSLNRP